MDKLVLFNDATRNNLLNKRSGESKFGQDIQILTSISNIYDQLKNLDVTYVILGVPEHVGVFANHGKVNVSKTWKATLKALLNIQSNAFTNPKDVLILGYFDFSEELSTIEKLNPAKKKDILKSRKIVEDIDKDVTQMIYQIVLAGKKPIIIGGGHNNAYGNIKGTSLALGKPINVINFNSLSGFRPEEGRHNDNGFTYAFVEGFLDKYFAFGLHENDISDKILKTLNTFDNLEYNTYEALEVRNEFKFKKELKRASDFISEDTFGVEINCNAIENIPNNTINHSGFSVKQTRQFLNIFAQYKTAYYLHICEAAPTNKNAKQVGKLITYLIIDFIKAKN